MVESENIRRRIAVVVLNDFTRDNRVLKIATALAERGPEVQVVALSKEGLPLYETREGGWSVRRILPFWNGLLGGSRFQIFGYAVNIIRGYRQWDVWHCNDAEAYVLGVFAQMWNPKLELVYDCHEFESERNAKSRAYLGLVAWFERRTIRRARSVITVSPSIVQAYQKRYSVHGMGPIFLVRNVPHAASSMPSKRPTFRERFAIPSNHFVALYQGAFTFNRGVEATLSAASMLESHGIHVVFMGYGPLENSIALAAADHANIHLHESVDYHELLAQTAGADVGLVSVKPTCLSYLYCLPNKLFEYIQAGIPILSNDLPDCAELIRTFDIGRVVEDDTSEGWAHALVQMKKSKIDYSTALKEASLQLQWQKEAQHLFEAHGV